VVLFVRGDAYMDVGGRKRLEHVFEGAAPTIHDRLSGSQ